jgi:hypothetical protein
MITNTKSQRLILLLDGLSATSFGPAPKGAGLKTAIKARELGLVEFERAGPAWRFRLTPAGLSPRLEHRRQTTPPT